MFHDLYLLPTITYGVSITVFHFTMFDLHGPTPVRSLLRHFQCNHGVSVPGQSCSGGMDVSLYLYFAIHFLVVQVFFIYVFYFYILSVYPFYVHKEQRNKWGYYKGDTTYDCGVSSENTRHMLECPLLEISFSLDDILQRSRETVCRTMEDSGLMTQ